MPVNYDNGKVYQIKCLETEKIYVGCTTKVILSARLAEHTCMYRQYLKNQFKYCSSFEVLEKNNYVIELLEDVPCKSRNELITRERHFIQSLECVNREGKRNYKPKGCPKGYRREDYVQGTSSLYTKNKDHILKWRETHMEKSREINRICAYKAYHIKQGHDQAYFDNQAFQKEARKFRKILF
jgi:hypothetical protein